MLQAADGGIFHIQVDGKDNHHHSNAGYEHLGKCNLQPQNHRNEKDSGQQTHFFLGRQLPLLYRQQHHGQRQMQQDTKETHIYCPSSGIAVDLPRHKYQSRHPQGRCQQDTSIEQEGTNTLAPLLWKA